MKPQDVSVMVSSLPNDELYVNITLKLKGNLLNPGDVKVQEHVRRAKAKEIRKVIETVVFPGEEDYTTVEDKDIISIEVITL